MAAHPHPPIRHCPVPHAGLPARCGVRKKSSDERLYENFLSNLLKTVIALFVMVLVFQGIVHLMDSKKLPFLKVSAEAVQGDGTFTLSTEYGFVREAYKPDGKKMSQDELRKLAAQPDAKFEFELVDSNSPSQW